MIEGIVPGEIHRRWSPLLAGEIGDHCFVVAVMLVDRDRLCIKKRRGIWGIAIITTISYPQMVME